MEVLISGPGAYKPTLILNALAERPSTTFSALECSTKRRSATAGTSGKDEFTDAQSAAYKLEKVFNFRWIAQHFGKHSRYILTAADRASPAVRLELSQIGQFAEVAYAMADPEVIWENLDLLSRPNYSFECYDVLSEAKLLCTLHGRATDVVIDTYAIPIKYPRYVKLSGYSRWQKPRVHAGFWQMYRGLRRKVIAEFASQLHKLEVDEVVVTGHSLGGAMSQYFLMDIFDNESCSKYFNGKTLNLPRNVTLKLAIFGSPRVGNETFAQLYRSYIATFLKERGEERYVEYCIKGYNDGAPALPPHSFGYRHPTQSTYFGFRGELYRVPASENECINFSVEDGDDGLPDDHATLAIFPYGGHNYYDDRDMERAWRRIRWIVMKKGKGFRENWEETYMEKLEKERRTLEGEKRKIKLFRMR